MTLKISTLDKQGVYQGSKWLKFQVLCDEVELEMLFAKLRPFQIFPLTGIVDGNPIEETVFLGVWREIIASLQNGNVPEEKILRKIFASALTDELDALWLQEIEGKGYLMKIARPVIQMQAHWLTYSHIDQVFRPMSMGPSSIFWGIQFSYPQIYQDPATMELKETDRPPLFEKLRYWVREETKATPFIVENQKTNVPIRLGKRCFSWICKHPQLIAQGIRVANGA